MKTLDEFAIHNLHFLQTKKALISNTYSLQNQVFVEKEADSFDTIYSCKDLEYPIFFTFHQILNHVNSSYKNTYMGHSKQEVIVLLEQALEVIYEYYNEIEEIHPGLEHVLEDLDNKVFFIKQYYRYGICLGLPTFIKNILNSTCVLFIDTSRSIIDEYIQEIKNPDGYDTDKEEIEESSDNEDDGDKKTH
jgi:hypothetical protein